MSKKPFVKKPMFGVEHLGGRKFVQPGAEYMHKEKETRRYGPGGHPQAGISRRARHRQRVAEQKAQPSEV